MQAPLQVKLRAMSSGSHMHNLVIFSSNHAFGLRVNPNLTAVGRRNDKKFFIISMIFFIFQEKNNLKFNLCKKHKTTHYSDGYLCTK